MRFSHRRALAAQEQARRWFIQWLYTGDELARLNAEINYKKARMFMGIEPWV